MKTTINGLEVECTLDEFVSLLERLENKAAAPNSDEVKSDEKDEATASVAKTFCFYGTYDFQDGQGPVPAHQHPNGGGWVADTAFVAETAFVGKNAVVFGWARVDDRAWVADFARIFGDAMVYNEAMVYGNAQVYGRAKVFGWARVFENAVVRGNAVVSCDAWVHGSVLCQC